ncbi:hypothetical protein [Caldalkalibacillus salinus]|uniref:hypothetical protein n=1 Tax=Caldalkalibacillus salinus TaxID=2803787 RepID=UPI001924D1E5|nr:hypothetical protein [Caldalkalibacillus salinus]
MFKRLTRLMPQLYTLTVKQSMLVLGLGMLPVMAFIIAGATKTPSTLSITMGRMAAVLFLLAFILYGFLVAIRWLPRSRFRYRLVLFTRLFIRFHISCAIFGLSFLILHISLIHHHYDLHAFSVWKDPKLTSGFMAILTLIPLLVTGYLRKQKASGARRRSHRYTGIVFVVAASIHVFLI